MNVVVKLFCNRCANRTYAVARTAIDALVSVDVVLAVAFSDSFYRALVNASTAHNAFVTNNVSHISKHLS